MELIFIHGPAAVGKLTVARALAELTGFALFHNHLTVDALTPVFPFGTDAFVALREQTWLSVFTEAARRGTSLIFTFTPERTVRPSFAGAALEAVTPAGGTVRFVRLICDEDERERRVESESRRRHGKLRSRDLLRELARAGAFEYPELPDSGLVIDTGRTSPAQAAARICEFFGLGRRATPIAASLSGETESPLLRGETVTLRALSADDAEALAAAAAESRDHYAYTRVPDGIADAARYIETALENREAGWRLPFAILWRDRMVGSTSYLEIERWRWAPGSPLQRTEGPDVVEIGATWLAASAQRTRCNTEAKYLLLCHPFDVWAVHRVALKTDERNAQSRRAIERLGARLDSLRRADMPGQDGTIRTSAYYSIVASEWPEIRARLEAALAR